MNIKLLLFIPIVLGSLFSHAQIVYNSWTVGVQAGNVADMPKAIIGKDGSNDAVAFGSKHAQFDWTIGIYVEKQLSPLIGLNFTFDRARMRGATDRDYYINQFSRFNLAVTFSLTNLSIKKEDPYINIYGTAGVGYNMYRAQRYFNSGLKNTLALRENDASQINFGFGMRYHFSEQWRIEIESTYNLVYDNGFDGDYSRFEDGEDQYLRTVIGVGYTFGSKQNKALHKTPLFSNYLWADKNIKKRIKLDDEYLAEEIEKNIADEKQDIENNTKAIEQTNARVDNVENKVGELDEKLDVFLNRSNYEIIHTRNVYYAIGKSQVTSEYQKIILELATVLSKDSTYLVDITGVTDMYAKESFNAKLRLKRANRVKDFMVNKLNIDPARITINTQKEKISGVPYQHLNRKSQIVVYKK